MSLLGACLSRDTHRIFITIYPWYFLEPSILITTGILITVSALVAAGVAVYESPQFRQWVDNSRRKLAQTLHNLGDEIQPREYVSPFREDISMTEDVGPAAEERRRAVREELERRGVALMARRKKSDGSPPSSFDSIVDREGRLLDLDDAEGVGSSPPGTLANSTAVDLGTSSSQPVQRGRPAGDEELLQLDDTSAPQSSATPAQLTPTSEVPSPLSLSKTEGRSAEYFYAPPEPFSDDNELHRPTTPSTVSDFSHVHNESAADDASSDGTLSDLGRQSVEGAATPAGWSDVGSEVSNDDINDYHF